MNGISDIIGKLPTPGSNPANPVATIATTALPALPRDLARSVEYAAPGRHADNDGNVLVINHEPDFHPDAARYADEVHRALLPAPTEIIRVWLSTLAKSMVPGPINADGLFEGLLDACGDLPAPVWSAAARRELLRTYTFLPGVAEIYAVLQPIAAQLLGQLQGLERVARASPGTRKPPSEPPEPYRPVACTPLKQQRSPKLPLRAVVDDFDPDEAARQDKVARLSARDQIAALGVTPAS
jgi:hypothetical protein